MGATSVGLIVAVKKGDHAAARGLLRSGSDPNSRDPNGMTALMWAARKGSRQLVTTLLEFGADPNARDRQGQKALHHAVAGKHPVVIRTLASAGADLNANDADDCTPFDLACLAEDYHIAKELVNLGAKGSPPDAGVIAISQARKETEYLPIHEAIDLLSLRLSDLPEHNPWGERGHLHVVFQTSGSRAKPTRAGIRKKNFSKKKRILVVQVAVPKSLLKTRPTEFLLDCIQKAVDLAERVFKRAKIDFAAAGIREQLQAIEVMKNWEFPDFRE
jgi:ankyrin repeat protein